MNPQSLDFVQVKITAIIFTCFHSQLLIKFSILISVIPLYKMKRVNVIAGHLASNSASDIVSEKTASTRFPREGDDVVVVSALRTPMCKSNRGGLKVILCFQIFFLLR